MTPTDEAILAAIQATPQALSALNAAAAALDGGMVDEAMDVLRDAALVVCDDFPELEPGPLQAVLGHLVAEMRRAEHRRQHMN